MPAYSGFAGLQPTAQSQERAATRVGTKPYGDCNAASRFTLVETLCRVPLLSYVAATFQIYRNPASVAVATFRPAFRDARFSADRIFSLLAARSARGTLSAAPSFKLSRSSRMVVMINLCLPLRPWGTSVCTIVLKWVGLSLTRCVAIAILPLNNR